MTRLVSLQMFSLLMFNEHMSAARSSPGCLSSAKLGRNQRRLWSRMPVPAKLLDARTCAQTAADMRGDLNNRSLSPWRYRYNVDKDRIPHQIPFAECVCGGCIIKGVEDFSYNSVPVYAWLPVLRRSPCPQNPKEFVVNGGLVKVPVGCTCAVPKFAG